MREHTSNQVTRKLALICIPALHAPEEGPGSPASSGGAGSAGGPGFLGGAPFGRRGTLGDPGGRGPKGGRGGGTDSDIAAQGHTTPCIYDG